MKELGLPWNYRTTKGGAVVQRDPTDALKEVMRQMAGKDGTKKAGKAKPRAKAKAKQPQKCECGCGKLTKGGRFLPGHDARLHSRLLKAAKDGNDEAKAELRKRGW